MKDFNQFKENLQAAVGIKNVIFNAREAFWYRTGIRVGGGNVVAVILPNSLLELWNALKICISFNKIIIMQAANTGLTGGSTPDGNNYDRDVVIINTLRINKILLLNNGTQTISFPGTTLYQLEEKLLPLKRGPHSIIGSSCIGASVIGGVCNNSGGNLVNRGPAYTELSLFARLSSQGKLELVNHLGIDLGDDPEEVISNLENVKFDVNNVSISDRNASDVEYKERVRDINANTPARFNSDARRLYEASGCAGKIAVFAVRIDTFIRPLREQVFFMGTNDPSNFTSLRKKILTEVKSLPDMGEYMHRSYFDGADKYCKDTFLFIKYFGTSFIPKLLKVKKSIDIFFASLLPFLPGNISDRLLSFISQLLPDHLPIRLRNYRNRFEHYLLVLASDEGIEEINKLLDNETKGASDYEYIKCSSSEGKDALLHRYVAGAAPSRFEILNPMESGELLPLDVALPRNCENWHQIIPDKLLSNVEVSFKMGHFLCMVFHWDFVVKKGSDHNQLKQDILNILDSANAKYPAEHNVGHLYKADKALADFYVDLDPTNTFNSGIGKTSKSKFYK